MHGDQEKIIKDYLKKIKILNKHNDLYYNKDKPILSDSDYDSIKKEINSEIKLF